MPRRRYVADNLGHATGGSRTLRDPHEDTPTFSGRGIVTFGLMVYRLDTKPSGPSHKVHFYATETPDMIPIPVTVLGKRQRTYFDVQLVTTSDALELGTADQRSFCAAVAKALEPLILPLTLEQRKTGGRISAMVLDLSGTAGN